MTGLRRVLVVSVPLALMTSLAAWVLDPSDTGELLLAVFPATYWGVVEAIARSRERWAIHGAAESRQLLEATVAFTATMIVLAQTAELAWRAGLVPVEDLAGLSRVRGALIGMWMAYGGDRLAKIPSPWRLRDEPFDWQRVHGFTGRLWVGVGAILVLLWTTAPVPTAQRFAPWLVIAALVAAPVRKLTSVVLYSVGHRPVAP
jgi:hypothetical protein